MKSASHTTIIMALKFTCSFLSVSYPQNCFTLRTVHNHLWTRVPTHLCNLLYKCISFMRRTLVCWHHCFKWESWKKLTPAPRTTHWPPLCRLPHGLLRRLPCGLPPQTTLNNPPNLILRGKRHKPTCPVFISAWISVYFILMFLTHSWKSMYNVVTYNIHIIIIFLII